MNNPEYPDERERAEIELRRRLLTEQKLRKARRSKGAGGCPHCGGKIGPDHGCNRRDGIGRNRS